MIESVESKKETDTKIVSHGAMFGVMLTQASQEFFKTRPLSQSEGPNILLIGVALYLLDIAKKDKAKAYVKTNFEGLLKNIQAVGLSLLKKDQQ
jgi:hypothetical protein